MKIRRALETVVVTCCMVVLAACGTTDADAPTVTSPPTTTAVAMEVTVEPTPHKPERARTAVEYDPCFTLPDQVVADLGFAPDSPQTEWDSCEHVRAAAEAVEAILSPEQ
ncbi:hypothetical protein ACL02S_17805 [Nocardia sp. 004]|uniref:hypothetical protein n=1 Tax=Nocardia sp. 004 TaxID=3385978 RepID=UPI0039A33F25